MRRPRAWPSTSAGPYRPGRLHAALLHAALIAASTASTGCATTSSSASASTSTHDARGGPRGAAAQAAAAGTRASPRGRGRLVQCLDTMIEEERQPLSGASWPSTGCARPTSSASRSGSSAVLPWPVRTVFGAVGLVSGRLAFALWYLRAMEESSIGAAHREMPGTRSRRRWGRWKPTFAPPPISDHMRDETRHLQIDGILVERCLAGTGRATRALNARLFKSLSRHRHAADARGLRRQGHPPARAGDARAVPGTRSG
jgi:hypothetical protein